MCSCFSQMCPPREIEAGLAALMEGFKNFNGREEDSSKPKEQVENRDVSGCGGSGVSYGKNENTTLVKGSAAFSYASQCDR